MELIFNQPNIDDDDESDEENVPDDITTKTVNL